MEKQINFIVIDSLKAPGETGAPASPPFYQKTISTDMIPNKGDRVRLMEKLFLVSSVEYNYDKAEIEVQLIYGYFIEQVTKIPD